MNQSPTIDQYLNGNDLYIAIYRELKKNHPGLFDYLQFFIDLDNCHVFFEANQENYYLIETEFSSKIQLDGLQLCVFLHYLIMLIENSHEASHVQGLIFHPAGRQSYEYILELYHEIKEELFPEQEETIAESSPVNASTSQIPEKTLADYLEDDFNITIYQELVEGGIWVDLFDPKQFLDLLYTEYDFFSLNRERYLVIKEHFDKLDLDGGMGRHYFFGNLLLLIAKNENVDSFSGVTLRSHKYLKRSLAAWDNPFPTEDELDQPLVGPAMTNKVEDKIAPSLSLNEIKPPLKQKVLAIKYLDQAGYFSLNKMHQDRTKQAAIISFLMGQSQKTTYDALGENIDTLKTRKNLTVLLELFEPLKDDYPQIFEQINKDLKSAK
jgi:hypothetical protein